MVDIRKKVANNFMHQWALGASEMPTGDEYVLPLRKIFLTS